MKRQLPIIISIGVLLISVMACSLQGTNIPPTVDATVTEVKEIETPTSLPPTETQPTEIPTNGVPQFPVIEAPQLTSIRFFDENNGWGLTSSNVLRTEDGGETWFNVTPSGVTDISFGAVGYFFDSSHGWLAVSNMTNPDDPGQLFRTSDGGASWAESALPPSMGGRFSFVDPDNGFFMSDLGAGAGSNWVGIYSTVDGGANWTPQYVPVPGNPETEGALPASGQKSGMTFIDSNRGWVTGSIPMDNYLYLYNTTNGGSFWNNQNGPVPTTFGTVFTSTYPPAFFGQDGIMPVTLVGNVINLVIYTSGDGGASWTPAPAPVANAGRGELVDFVSPLDGFAWANGRFAVTHDGAESWGTVTPSVPFGDNMAFMDFVDTTTGWVVTMNADSHNSLYKTTDGGTNWITLIP